MKNFQKLILFSTCISLIISITFIAQTYAKYATSISGNANISIARWNIVVNNLSVKNNSDFSSVIAPVFSGSSNIASNVIAPEATGYFDLDFDFSEVDVSFDYSISISVNEESSVSDLIATGYKVDNGTLTSFSDSSQSIDGHIDYGDGITSRAIRIYIKWDDSEVATMNNLADTLATFDEDNSALLDVTISFTQTT